MVDETNTELTKLPFKPEGLIFLISSTKLMAATDDAFALILVELK